MKIFCYPSVQIGRLLKSIETNTTLIYFALLPNIIFYNTILYFTQYIIFYII